MPVYDEIGESEPKVGRPRGPRDRRKTRMKWRGHMVHSPDAEVVERID